MATEVTEIVPLWTLKEPRSIRAEMARRGLLSGQLADYHDPERGWVRQMDDRETQASIKHFLYRLERALLAAEVVSDEGSADGND